MNAPAPRIVPNAHDRYRAMFHALHLPDNALTTLRTAALERFLDAGFPTQRDEAWKYTNLRRLESRHFALPEAAALPGDESLWIAHAGARRVLVDGWSNPALSSAMAYPPGVTVLTLGQWLANSPEQAAEFLRQHAPDPSAFSSLNQALLGDGIVVDIGENVVCDLPLYLVHHWSSSGRMSHPRIIVRAARNSRCVLIEHYVGAAAAESFTNTVTSIAAGGGE